MKSKLLLLLLVLGGSLGLFAMEEQEELTGPYSPYMANIYAQAPVAPPANDPYYNPYDFHAGRAVPLPNYRMSWDHNGRQIFIGYTEKNGKKTAALLRYNAYLNPIIRAGTAPDDFDIDFGKNGLVEIPVGAESKIYKIDGIGLDNSISVSGFAKSVDGLDDWDIRFTATVNSDGTIPARGPGELRLQQIGVLPSPEHKL